MNEFLLLNDDEKNIELNNENKKSKNDLIDIDMSNENEQLKKELKEKEKIIEKMKNQNILLNKLLVLRDKKIQELKKELNETNDKLIQCSNQNQNNLNRLYNIHLSYINSIIHNQGIIDNINNNNQNLPQTERVNNERIDRNRNQNMRLNSNRNIRIGLTQNEIDRIPNETFNNQFNYENIKCIICLNEFKNGDLLKRLGCLYIFHKNCITLWLRRKKVCPIDNHRVNVNLDG